MNTPHKHAALIKAWADGATIKVFDEDRGIWETVDSHVAGLGWYTHKSYRVKPETRRVRVALLSAGTVVAANVISSTEQEAHIRKNGWFVRWLSDWIEYD